MKNKKHQNLRNIELYNLFTEIYHDEEQLERAIIEAKKAYLFLRENKHLGFEDDLI